MHGARRARDIRNANRAGRTHKRACSALDAIGGRNFKRRVDCAIHAAMRETDGTNADNFLARAHAQSANDAIIRR